jgi:hypothetical protein
VATPSSGQIEVGLGIRLNSFWHFASCGVARSLALAFICGVVLCGLAPAQEPPASPPSEQPEQEKQLPSAPDMSQPNTNKPDANKPDANKKDENGNPVEQAVDTTREVAKTQILRARDWESGLIAGIYVGKNRKLVPLTREERINYYLHQTFTRPEDYVKRMFAAGVDQARGVPYQWDDGWAGYAERFASREGQFFTSNSLAALGNAKLGYEVRYDKCKCSAFKGRLRHAIVRNFLTYDRSESHWRPQLGLYGGAFGGGLMVTAWKPGNRSPWANGGWAMLGQAGYGSLVNLITEFSTEINRKQGVGR